jgi:hypothetical protein
LQNWQECQDNLQNGPNLIVKRPKIVQDVQDSTINLQTLKRAAIGKETLLPAARH